MEALSLRPGGVFEREPLSSLPDGVVVTPTSMRFTRPITFEQWRGIGLTLSEMRRSIHWWLGDWLRFGESTYGEMYSQAIEETGFDYGTLANDKYVAGRFDPSLRREELSFAHHRAAASVQDASERAAWLDAAVERGLTREELHLAIQTSQGDGPLPPEPGDRRIVVLSRVHQQALARIIAALGPGHWRYSVEPGSNGVEVGSFEKGYGVGASGVYLSIGEGE